MASKGRSSRSRRNTASRGFVNNTILECLLDGDKYGYEIIKEVKDKTDGKVVLKEPSLYSSLKRFEQKGYISSYWGDSDIGGRRHYYSLTEPGRNYYISIKSPTSADLDDLDDVDNESSIETEQLTIENINDEIYNIENNVEEVDDSAYINNISFDVNDRLNELLSEDITPALAEIDDDTSIFEEHTNSIEPIEDSQPEESEKELIEEISSAVHTESQDDYEDISNIETKDSSEYSDYMYEHKFRNDTKQELSNGNEKYVQYDLFSDNNTQNNYVDTPEITPTEIVSDVDKEQLSANNTEKEITKEIPLIEEKEISFFNWNEMKRQVSSNKTSFSNKSNTSTSGITSKSTTNRYDLNQHSEDTYNFEPVNNDYKTKNDLHTLFNNTISNTSADRVINNISPNKVDNRIFDNVKDRIELNDAVIGKQKEVVYNDEPELTQEQYEVLNRKLNEKFDSIAETRTTTKKELDYKKILGDLYYNDTVTNTSNNAIDQYEEPVIQEYIENYEDYDNNNYEELINNDIEDEKIANAINKSKIYSYNTLQESLSNDGFKFKPYSIDMSEDDTEHFVKINKVRFIYGTVMSLIMLLQIATIFVILKSNGYVYAHDTALYIISLIACVATFVTYLVPYITRKDERKSKFYNLNYHLMFGVLYLFCGLILTYAVNLIMGLNHANTISFLSRLILPAILLTNCIISPIVYKMIMDNKNIK